MNDIAQTIKAAVLMSTAAFLLTYMVNYIKEIGY